MEERKDVCLPDGGGVVNVEEGETVLRHGPHDALSQTPFHSTTLLVLRHTHTACGEGQTEESPFPPSLYLWTVLTKFFQNKCAGSTNGCVLMLPVNTIATVCYSSAID